MVADRAVRTPDNLDVIGRPTPAKAGLADKRLADSLSPVVKDAAKYAYGKQGAAAAKLAKNEGNFSRDVDAERMTLKDLRALGPVFLVAFAKGVLDEYGPLDTPHARALKLLRQNDQNNHELAQLLDHLAERTA
jgi:hypothetical protein